MATTFPSRSDSTEIPVPASNQEGLGRLESAVGHQQLLPGEDPEEICDCDACVQMRQKIINEFA